MSTRHSGTALLACLVLLSAGCSGDPDPAPDAAPTQTPASTAPSSPSPEPSQTVEPASGPRVDRGPYAVNFPAGWRVDKQPLMGLIFGDDPESFSDLAVTTADGTGFSRDELMRIHERQFIPAAERQDDLLVDGEEMWHFSGTDDGLLVDYWGHLFGDQDVYAVLHTEGRPAVRDQLLDSVLASWQWQ